MSETPLCVIIEGATGLRNADIFSGKSDPYCICQVGGQLGTKVKTRTIQDDLNPVWNHKFVLPGLNPKDVLEFTIMDEDFGKDDELLGRASLLGEDVAAGFAGELPLSEDGQGGTARLQVTIKVPAVNFDEKGSLALWPTWVAFDESKPLSDAKSSLVMQAFSRSRGYGMAQGASMARVSFIDMEERPNLWILHPECMRRLSWDIMGLFVLLLDLIWLPMQVFDPPETPLIKGMSWLTLLYWTCDILISCSTGYYTVEGIIVMSRRHILGKYAKTWLFLDLPLVLVDWSVLMADLFSSEADSAGAVRSAKLVRVTRVMRLLRLMRLMKLRKVLFAVQSLIDSEWLTLVMAVVKNLATIIAINHFLACFWYLVGRIGGTSGWVAKEGLHDMGLDQQYLISLHWSLAQFTPGATPVQAYTVFERAVTVTVLAMGMVIATCFVSSITSTMASVWTANRYDSTQHLLLKKFLHQNKVSRGLGSRITHYVDFILELRHKRVHISKVHFLSFLSGPLHIDLQTELFTPTISLHPCFYQIDQTSKSTMREICTTAVTGTQNYAKNDMIFHRGVEAKHLLFLTLGSLVYRFQPAGFASPRKVRVDVGSWCVEAVLWAPWRHTGEMKALSEADVVSVHAAKFRDICEGYPKVFKLARGYAHTFWQEAQEREEGLLTDIGFDLGLHEVRIGRRISMRRPLQAMQNMAELAHAEDVQAHLVQWDD